MPKQSRTPGAVREVIVVQQKTDPTRPKPDFADAKIFRSAEGIFILDKNPIWMTRALPDPGPPPSRGTAEEPELSMAAPELLPAGSSLPLCGGGV